MELKQLTDRIWYCTNEEYGDRPVLGYIKGDRYSLAVDAGNSATHVKEFYRLLSGAGLTLPSLTVITHWHWDHTFGMHRVAGRTVACRRTAEKLAEVAHWKWDDESMAARLASGEDIPFCDGCIREEYHDRSIIRVTAPDIIFEGKLTVDLGGLSCTLLDVPSPHCDDNVLVHIPDERVLFAGDASCGDFYRNDGYCNPDKLARYVELLQGLDFTCALFGHDGPRTREAEFAALAEEAATAQ